MNPLTDDADKNTAELVMTVPEPYGAYLAYQARCRTTIGVLIELLAHAKRRVIMGAPFIQSSCGIGDGVLAIALQSALRRNTNIEILSTGSSLRTLEQEPLFKGATGKIQLFRPSDNLTDVHKLGSHAKFCVVDGESAYIGSANLTSPGLSGQLELGVLVHGEIAYQIEQFWDYAVGTGLFVLVS